METSERLKQNIPQELVSLPITINYGNSMAEDAREGIVINTQKAIKRCLDKKKMFRYLAGYSVRFLNLRNPMDVLDGLGLVKEGKGLVFRKGSKIKIVESIHDFVCNQDFYDYCTLKEEKVFEYRVLMFHYKVFGIKFKYNLKGTFSNKQEACMFIDVPIDLFEELYGSKVLSMLSAAVKKIGIHLCGVDLIRNEQGEFKVLEVNSGAGMCGDSVRAFYRLLIKMIEEAK